MASSIGAYMQRFGPLAGLSLYLRTRYQRGLLDVELPGAAGPLRFRSGTSDRGVFTQIFVRRAYDYPYPGRPRFIIDAGANAGYATVRFAQLYPEARIVAVEPDSGNYAALSHNVAPYPNVRTLNAGVWPRSTRLVIDNPDAGTCSFQVREARDHEPGSLAAVSIGELLTQQGAGTLDILKIDVEGTELEIFSDPGCQSWLARTNLIFIELHDRFKPGCESAVRQALTGHPFEWLAQPERTVVLQRHPPV
ncbi:MAG: FkbM family methyltransferase [Gammaproteobacteria bacterium]|nr:FkbM family methyltransferase [Gammaproteobacteria bacterium]